MKYTGAFVFLIVLLFIAGSFASLNALKKRGEAPVTSFLSCAEAGFPVEESFPRRCRDASGNVFTEDVGTPSGSITNEKVRVFFPTPGASVGPVISFSGQARGTWYFEASFPVELRSATGSVIAIVPAQAQGEWMTTEFVPFEGSIDVPEGTAGGTLFFVLKKDNPSGDPARDEEVVIPVNYIPAE